MLEKAIKIAAEMSMIDALAWLFVGYFLGVSLLCFLIKYNI